jgi:hypothetical protein
VDPQGDLDLEITIDDKALTIWSGINLGGLRPIRNLPGGELWE